MKNIFAAALGFLSSIAFAGEVESFEITTPRGETVPVDIHYPKNASVKSPVFVIAPGGNYHKDNLIFTSVAEELTNAGIIAVRFNYAYCKMDPVTKKCTGKWAEDLLPEQEDMSAVLAAVKKDARVDTTRIAIGGKSLGTLVSYPIFKKNEDLKALFLLTPLCTDTDVNPPAQGGEASYPGLKNITRPIVFMLGNNDPTACELPMLYDFLKDSKGNVTNVVVGGDHVFSFGQGEEFTARNKENISFAAKSVVQWMKIVFKL